MPVRIAALIAGFTVIFGFAALPDARATEVKLLCDDPAATVDCTAVDPVQTGTITDEDEPGLLLSNSEAVLPGMPLLIKRPAKLRPVGPIL